MSGWYFDYDWYYDFDIGDIVQVGRDDLEAVVVDVSEESYTYRVRFFNEQEKREEEYNRYGMEFLYHDSEMEEILTEPDAKSDLKIGDVVEIHSEDSDNNNTAVIEAYGEKTDTYIVNFFYEETERKEIYDHSMLEFLYHDSAQCSMFMDNMQNVLPPWNSKVYNIYRLLDDSYMYMFFADYYDEYTGYTLTYDRMLQIMNEHSFSRRIETTRRKMKKIIKKHLNWTDKKIDDEYRNIVNHFRKINEEYYDEDVCCDPKIKYEHWFSNDERRYLSLLYEYDKSRWSDRSKDYFPFYMSCYEIQKAIKEAYSKADKIGSGGRSRILYEGKSKAGLRIRFIFNVNKKQIVTAYPVYAEEFNQFDGS